MFRKTKEFFKERTFLKSLSVLAFGSIASQAITLLISPIISRVYLDYEMGEYTLILSIISLFSAVTMGRYDLTIVSESNSNYVKAIIRLCKFLLLITTPVVSMICFLQYFLSNEQKLSPLVYGISIAIALFFNGLILIYQSVLNRSRQYEQLAIANIINISIKNLGTVVLGLLGLGIYGLIISLLLGLLVQVVWIKKKITTDYLTLQDITNDTIKYVARKHIRQPLYSVPACFANNFSAQSTNIFIKSLFGNATLGQFSFSHRILALPISIISANVSKVYFETASREYEKKGNYLATFKKTTIFLSLIAIPIGLSIFFLGPKVIVWLLGSKWSEAGIMSRYMAPLYSVQFIVSPLTLGSLVSEKQYYELQMQILFVLCALINYFVAKFYYFDVITYLIIVSLSSSFLYLLYFIRLYFLSKKMKGVIE
jgi:O-antigen/teichoic acid export membrane protein